MLQSIIDSPLWPAAMTRLESLFLDVNQSYWILFLPRCVPLFGRLILTF